MGAVMLIHLSDVLTTEGKIRKLSVEIEADCFDNGAERFPITEKTPIAFTFTNIGSDKARVEGSAKVTFEGNCDRCLAKVPVTMELTIDRVVTSPEVASQEDEEQSFMDGWQLDVEALIHDEFVVNWPVKILCREDCKGVCPVCGQNRNERECGCDTFVPDPRMAAIQDIFNRG